MCTYQLNFFDAYSLQMVHKAIARGGGMLFPSEEN